MRWAPLVLGLSGVMASTARAQDAVEATEEAHIRLVLEGTWPTELAEDLGRFLNDEPILGRVPGITERAWRIMLRNRFTNVTVWGWILVITGISGGLFHLTQAWNYATEQEAFSPNIIRAVNLSGAAEIFLWSSERHGVVEGDSLPDTVKAAAPFLVPQIGGHAGHFTVQFPVGRQPVSFKDSLGSRADGM